MVIAYAEAVYRRDEPTPSFSAHERVQLQPAGAESLKERRREIATVANQLAPQIPSALWTRFAVIHVAWRDLKSQQPTLVIGVTEQFGYAHLERLALPARSGEEPRFYRLVKPLFHSEFSLSRSRQLRDHTGETLPPRVMSQ